MGPGRPRAYSGDYLKCTSPKFSKFEFFNFLVWSLFVVVCWWLRSSMMLAGCLGSKADLSQEFWTLRPCSCRIIVYQSVNIRVIKTFCKAPYANWHLPTLAMAKRLSKKSKGTPAAEAFSPLLDAENAEALLSGLEWFHAYLVWFTKHYTFYHWNWWLLYHPQLVIIHYFFHWTHLWGSSHNASLLSAAQDALTRLKDLWPGIEHEPPLGLGHGGQNVACMKMWYRYRHWILNELQGNLQ